MSVKLYELTHVQCVICVLFMGCVTTVSIKLYTWLVTVKLHVLCK